MENIESSNLMLRPFVAATLSAARLLDDAVCPFYSMHDGVALKTGDGTELLLRPTLLSVEGASTTGAMVTAASLLDAHAACIVHRVRSGDVVMTGCDGASQSGKSLHNVAPRDGLLMAVVERLFAIATRRESEHNIAVELCVSLIAFQADEHDEEIAVDLLSGVVDSATPTGCFAATETDVPLTSWVRCTSSAEVAAVMDIALRDRTPFQHVNCNLICEIVSGEALPSSERRTVGMWRLFDLRGPHGTEGDQMTPDEHAARSAHDDLVQFAEHRDELRGLEGGRGSMCARLMCSLILCQHVHITWLCALRRERRFEVVNVGSLRLAAYIQQICQRSVGSGCSQKHQHVMRRVLDSTSVSASIFIAARCRGAYIPWGKRLEGWSGGDHLSTTSPQSISLDPTVVPSDAEGGSRSTSASTMLRHERQEIKKLTLESAPTPSEALKQTKSRAAELAALVTTRNFGAVRGGAPDRLLAGEWKTTIEKIDAPSKTVTSVANCLTEAGGLTTTSDRSVQRRDVTGFLSPEAVASRGHDASMQTFASVRTCACQTDAVNWNKPQNRADSQTHDEEDLEVVQAVLHQSADRTPQQRTLFGLLKVSGHAFMRLKRETELSEKKLSRAQTEVENLRRKCADLEERLTASLNEKAQIESTIHLLRQQHEKLARSVATKSAIAAVANVFTNATALTTASSPDAKCLIVDASCDVDETDRQVIVNQRGVPRDATWVNGSSFARALDTLSLAIAQLERLYGGNDSRVINQIHRVMQHASDLRREGKAISVDLETAAVRERHYLQVMTKQS